MEKNSLEKIAEELKRIRVFLETDTKERDPEMYEMYKEALENE